MLTNRSMPPGVIIPVLGYPDVDAAVTWLCEAFGFSERLRIGNHRAQLCFEGAAVVVARQPSDFQPQAQANSRAAVPPARDSIMVRVEDVDRHYERALERGAAVIGPPETYHFGERQYTVKDPAGHLWTFSQPASDVAPEAWGGQFIDEC